MSLVRKNNKVTFKTNVDDFYAAMDQKNNIIYSLQTQLQTLRPNQDKFDKVKQDLIKIKAKQQALIRDYQRIVSNNSERLDLSAINIQQLRIQSEHLVQELRLTGQTLKEARFTTQQLIDLENKKEDESTECRIKFEEMKSIAEVLKIQEQRTRLQIYQLKEQVDKGKKEKSWIKNQNQEINQKCYKTQSYIRGLVREEGNLNQNLFKIQDENHKLDTAVSQLSTLVAINQCTISQKEKDIQEICFNISNKELEKKKIENEIKEKVKHLNAQKEKSKLLSLQLEQNNNESNRIQKQLKEVCGEINYIFTKNHQIQQVNQQLNEDLTVCQKHRENVLRTNKILESQIQGFKNQSLKAISKLQMSFKNRSNYTQQTELKAKWGNSSRITNYQTGDFQRRSQRT